MKVTRISGADRYKTAVEASKEIFKEGSKFVVVASGEGFADALVGGTLASQIKAPILLVGKDKLSKEVEEELIRLNPDKVFLLGGTNTISDNVFYEIVSLKTNVKRLYGKNRYETAVKIANQRFEFATETLFIDDYAAFNGNDFADALSAAPFVGQQQWMRLIPYVKGGKPAGIVFGGTSSVPKMVDNEIRYSGKDRYETAIKIADAYKDVLKKDIDKIVLVDGTKYPDALSSASVASMKNAAILLTNPKNFTKVTSDYIQNNKNIKEVIIVGGNNSVSEGIEEIIEKFQLEKTVDNTEEKEPTDINETIKPIEEINTAVTE